ncbi:hypothetical protein ACHAXS_002050 [Conticribra weissflogii]
MGVLDIVEHEDDMKAFNCKRFSNGTVKKINACCCAHGHEHLAGIDFFEIYAPGVQYHYLPYSYS